MKPWKILSIFLTVVLLISAGAWVFMQYDNAQEEKSAAQSTLDNTARMRDLAVAETPGLEAQLTLAGEQIKEWQAKVSVAEASVAKAGENLEQARSLLPGEIAALDYDETLLAMTYAAGLEMISLETSEMDVAEVEGHDGFIKRTFTINVRGTVAEILELYSFIVSDSSFRTAGVEPLTVRQPLPFSNADRQELAQEYFDQLYAELEDSLSGEERLLLIEEAILEMLDEPCDEVTVEAMTGRILDTISAQFDAEIAGRLAGEVAVALKTELADTLIGLVADIYGTAIGELFTEEESELTPEFLGILGPDITEKLVGVPPNSIPGLVSNAIAEKLNAMVEARLKSMIDTDEVERRVSDAAKEAEKATAVINITVTAYQGVKNVQG